MADSTPKHDEVDADLEQVRQIVQTDYDRIQGAEDPWTVLNLSPDDDPETVTERYERYEQFYRAENFKRFGDKELTRKALEIRKWISRAVIDMQAKRSGATGGVEREIGAESADLPATVGPDAAALADIYFRDGITYLRLDDVDSALRCFQRSLDHDPGGGETLAYHAYALFRKSPEDDTVVEECRESLRTAAMIESNNPQVHLLIVRFGLQAREFVLAEEALERVKQISSKHPDIPKLQRKLDELQGRRPSA
jgi:tetratricopeptide (TPR) repeat protein